MNEQLQVQLARFNASVARAQIRALGMQAENMQAEKTGRSIPYGEQAFQCVIDEEGIDYNSAIERTRT